MTKSPERPEHADVTVVIPTVNRPHLLVRAVRSALTQTLPPREIVVVQDGDHAGALAELSKLTDPRIVVTRPETPSADAGATSRNVGVRTATSEWVAFLDDDDEWLPHKLQAQFDAVERWGSPEPVLVSGQVERRTEHETDIWPTRAIADRESVSDYLFVRRSPGEGWLPTPTLLTRRETAVECPFTTGIRVHEDLDWLLKLERVGVRFLVVESVVAIVHVVDPGSLSTRSTWRSSLQWAVEHRDGLGLRAYSAFCLTEVSRMACQDASFRTFATILRASLAGRVRLRDVLQHSANTLLPRKLRDELRTVWRRRSERATISTGLPENPAR